VFGNDLLLEPAMMELKTKQREITYDTKSIQSEKQNGNYKKKCGK